MESRAMNQYTAVIKQDGDWWIGWIEEAPGVNCQEATREALLDTLRITPEEAIEMNREQPWFSD
jgi:predicted RNase H-like HicB family nuclease